MVSLYTIPERVHINGWGSSQDVSRQARFRLRNGGASAVGPIEIAGPRTPHFEVDGPRKVALGPNESVPFTVRFLVPRNNGANVQDACVFSIGGKPHCYIRFQASRDHIDAHQATFFPPESDLLPAVLRSPPKASAVATADDGRPRSGRASRAVTEVMKARGSGGGAPLLMLHPDREDLFFMEGLWYDSRGLEWNPTSTAAPESVAADKSPRATGELEEHRATQVERRHQSANPRENVSSKTGPPDWVMGMLDGDATIERPQPRPSECPGRGSPPPVAAAKQNSEQSDGPTINHATATPPVYHGKVEGGDPEEDSDEHDDFGDLLEQDLSQGGRGSIKPARKTPGVWKMASSNRSAASDNNFEEDDGGYAEQLAMELQRDVGGAAPAAKARAAGRSGPNKHHRPTAVERREQDAKWMACN